MTPRLQKTMEEMAEKFVHAKICFGGLEYSLSGNTAKECRLAYLEGATKAVTERDKELLEGAGEFDHEKATKEYYDKFMEETKHGFVNARTQWMMTDFRIGYLTCAKEAQLKLAALVDAKNWAIDMASSYRDECEQLRTLWECHGDKLQWGPLQNANKIRDERLSDEDVISLSKQLLAKDKELASLREERDEAETNEAKWAVKCAEKEAKLQAQDALLRECYEYNDGFTLDLLNKLTAHLDGK